MPRETHDEVLHQTTLSALARGTSDSDGIGDGMDFPCHCADDLPRREEDTGRVDTFLPDEDDQTSSPHDRGAPSTEEPFSDPEDGQNWIEVAPEVGSTPKAVLHNFRMEAEDPIHLQGERCLVAEDHLPYGRIALVGGMGVVLLGHSPTPLHG